MWLWTRTLALVLLLSLVSAGSLPHKNRNKIQYIDFDIPLVCHDEVFDRKRVSKIGKKACHRQSKFDNCGLINSCGLAKHHFAPDKYNGQIYSHECCYHMTWPFPMKKKNKDVEAYELVVAWNNDTKKCTLQGVLFIKNGKKHYDCMRKPDQTQWQEEL